MRFMSAVTILFLIITIVTIINVGGKYVLDNENINTDSLALLETINDSLEDEYYIDDLTETGDFNESDLNPEDEDSFGFEFSEARSSANKKIGIINTLTNFPSLLVNTIPGITITNSRPYVNLVGWLIGIMLSVITFNAVFRREVSK